MNSAVRSWLFALGGIALLGGGFFAGVQLGERASEPGTQALTLDRPSAAEPRDPAIRSAGGFTGFEEGALPGAVTRHGVIEPGEEGVLGVATESARIQLRMSSIARVYRLAPASDALAPGDVVVVRLAEDGTTGEAVLRVPADLREGDSR